MQKSRARASEIHISQPVPSMSLSLVLNYCYTALHFLFSGGFYSDTVGYVAESCKKCPNGSFVPYHKTPGTRYQDCTSCPLGKLTNHSILFI